MDMNASNVKILRDAMSDKFEEFSIIQETENGQYHSVIGHIFIGKLEEHYHEGFVVFRDAVEAGEPLMNHVEEYLRDLYNDITDFYNITIFTHAKFYKQIYPEDSENNHFVNHQYETSQDKWSVSET